MDRRVFLGMLGSAFFSVGKAAEASDHQGLQYAVFDAKSGLPYPTLSQHADTPRHPASLTKIMTGYIILQAMRDPDNNFGPETLVHIPYFDRKAIPEDIYVDPEIYLTWKANAARGQDTAFPAKHLLKLLGSRSCAVATDALVVHVGGLHGAPGSYSDQRRRFVARMNAKTKELGMENTHFTNTIGIPDWQMEELGVYEPHVSTPSDMARLIAFTQHDEADGVEMAFGKPNLKRPKFSERLPRHHSSGMLLSRPELVAWAKTGTTKASGSCLGVLAEENGRQFAGVVLGATDPAQATSVMTSLIKKASRLPLPKTPPGHVAFTREPT